MHVSRLVAHLGVLILCALAASSALAVNDVTVTAVPTTVSGSGQNTSVVTAQAPIVTVGAQTQELTQQFDPTKLRLTGIDGVQFPEGWTTTFSADGTTFGPAPTTVAGWSAIQSVRTTGPVNSQGADNGRQVATGSATEPAPTGGTFVSGGAGRGDGYDVFFDDQNHVFNVWHHQIWPDGAVDCHLRTGATCGPGWPFTIKGTTSSKSSGGVDTVYDHLWVPTGTPNSGSPTPSPPGMSGFVCVDISSFATGPRFCNGTFENTFIPMAPITMASTSYDNVHSPVIVGSRMFAWSASATDSTANPSDLICVDMHANGGLGAVCPGTPMVVAGISRAREVTGDIKESNGRLYLTGLRTGGGASDNAAACLVPETLQPCPGWSPPKSVTLSNSHGPIIYEQPTAAGVIEGVCFKDPLSTIGPCFKEDGTALTANAGLKAVVDGQWTNRTPDTVGSRVYFSQYDGSLRCFDVGTGASCPGWPKSPANHYTLVADPYNANCVWRNGHDGMIVAYDASGAVGCTTPPPWADLEATALVPRMACSEAGAVREWRTFTLTSPAASTYTGATLTVFTAEGTVVVSNGITWANVPIPAGTRTVDLSSLLPADSGADPTFRVTLAGRTTWDAMAAEVKIVGDAPQLCLTVAAESVCPIGPAQIPAGPLSVPFATLVGATGSATLNGTVMPFTAGSTSVTVGTPTEAECLGTISGTTTVGTAAGPAAVGVPVTLKDSTGRVIATTTTDASGNYAFPRLAAASGYFVDFGDAAGYVVTAATTTAESTNRTVTAGQVTDVDGLYTTRIWAPSRTQTIAPATSAVFAPFEVAGASAAATPGNGASFRASDKAVTRLCDPTTTPPQNGTTVPCTRTSFTTAQGTWSVNTTAASADVGKITFTPVAGFSGTATPMTYQVSDSLTSKATGVLTPIVPPPPSLTPDTNTDAWDTNQVINPLANDTAASGTTLDPTSVRICATGTAAASCTGTTLTTAEGTYTVNPTTGRVTFDPLPTFIGTAPAIQYVVADSLGQKSTSTIRPTVLPPPPDTPNPDTSIGPAGQAQTINPLANDITVSGVTLTATSVRLCGGTDVAPDCNQTSVVVLGQGTYTVNPVTGAITFTPVAGFSGTATGVPYSVIDSVGREVSSTYTPTVVPAPTANPDTSTGPWDQVQTITPLGNDTAGTGTALDPTTVRLCATGTVAASCTGTTLTNADGTYTVNVATGVVTFDPVPGFTGDATPIAYVVVDGLGQRAMSTITPHVDPPAPPVATPETRSVVPGGTATFTTVTGTGGLASTGGPAFVTTSTCLIAPGSNPAACDADGVIAVPGEGTWTLNQGTGVVTFAADGSAVAGTQTPISYRVTDATGQSATSTLTPVVPVQPTVRADTSIGQQGSTQIISPLSNDAGTAAAPLVSSTLRLCDPGTNPAQVAPNCTATSITIPNVGTYTVLPDGTVRFVPDPGYTGTAPAVGYQVADSLGQVGSSSLFVTVLPPPVVGATADTGGAGFGQPVVFSPLTNDSAGTLPPTDGNPYTQVGTVTLVPGSVRLCGDTQTGQGLTPCTLTSLVVSGQGTYSVNTTTGAITFTPEAGFQGTPVSPPRYMVCNQIGGTWMAGAQDVTAQVQATCATATVTPTIGPPSALAVNNDVSRAGWDQTQSISVLNNDGTDAMLTLAPTSVKLCNPATTPPQATPNCTATRLDVANVGTYTVNPDGTVSFDPLPGFSGTVATPVAYQVADSLGRIAGATITPTVDPPAVPVAGDEQKLLLPGATVAFTTITGGSGLAAGQGLQTSGANATCLITPGSSPAACDADGVVTIAGEGTYTLNPATGVVTFTAAPGAPAGPLTPITYRVTDVTGQVDTGTLTPVLVGTPIADPETSTGAYNTPQVIDVLTGDIAASGATLVPTSVKLCDPDATPTAEAPPNCTATRLVVAGQGVYTVNPTTGAVTFTPVATFTGTATAAVYQVADSLGQVAGSLITPSVSDPALPTAGPAAHPVAVGIAQPFPAITGGSGLAGGPAALTASSTCLIDPATSNCVTTVNIPGEGTWVLNPASGIATFTADPGATPGALTPITYRVTDVLGRTVTSTLTPTLTGPPAATDDSATTPAGTPVSVSALANDQADALTTLAPATVVLCGVNPAQSPPGCTQTTLAVPGEGTYSVYPLTGQVTFTPAPGFTGVATPVPYQMQDALGQVASATITITVTPAEAPPAVTPAPSATPLVVPPAPIALPDAESTGKGQPVTLPVLLNDSGSGAAPFVPSSVVMRDPASGRYQSQVTIPGEGTFRANPDGTITFTPDPGFAGVTRTLPYRVTDVTGRTTSSTVQVTVHENPPPWADPDFAQGPTGHPLVLNPLGNDESGPSSFDPTSLRLVTPDGKLVTRLVVPGEGTYVVDPATGRVTFTPVRGFTGRSTPVPYRLRTLANEPVKSTITVYITAPRPALQISTTASRPVLRVGQKTTITLAIANHGLGTAKSTVTRAAIPRGFVVANPMGGVVRGGYIYFRTGHLKAGGTTTRRFVLVAGSGARGTQDVNGRSRGSNVGPVNDPVALRVTAPAPTKGQPVTG